MHGRNGCCAKNGHDIYCSCTATQESFTEAPPPPRIEALVMTGGCRGCPFAMVVEDSMRMSARCIATANNRPVRLSVRKAPTWCPLRSGPITVSYKES